MARKALDMQAGVDELHTLLEKPSISKADRKRIEALVQVVMNTFSDSMPFYLDQFGEAATRVASQAKAEVDAFITTAVMNAGIESLRAKAPEFALAGPEQTEKELV